MLLTSPQNPLLKKLRTAVASGKPLDDDSVVAEGPHLLSEALKGCWQITGVFCSSEALERHADLLAGCAQRRIEVTEVQASAFQSISDTEHTQGILTLLRPREFNWRDITSRPHPLIILDRIQDPGNAGAILRSAEAFSSAGVALTIGSVRMSNGKFLRAAAGSAFRLPYMENVSPVQAIAQVKSTGRRLFALSADGSTSIQDTDFLGAPFAIVVGSEGSGVSAEFLHAAEAIFIRTAQVESLNAGIACSIALYEYARQLSSKQEVSV